MSEPIRWGIISTGWIARQFARALKTLPQAELAAVGSRRQRTADAFGDEFGIPRRFGSYADLCSDPEVDVVYIGTPHSFHHRDALMALEADKHVLVEKAFTLNAREAREIIELAREKGLFAMEAMWTRFFPLMTRLRELLAEGEIGELKMVRADLSHIVPYDPSNRFFEPQLGGGALLDLGVYPISLASMVLGTPQTVAGEAHIGQTGIDEQGACVLGYEAGQLAVLSFSIGTNAPREAAICGTEGIVQINGRWQGPASMTVTQGSDSRLIELPFDGNGYQFEAIEVMDRIRAGDTESEVMPLDETLAIMGVMDELRSQWGLIYPGEEDG